MITDYSSIRYPILDRPLMLCLFDHDIYITNAANLVYDYSAMTGPKMRTLQALLVEQNYSFSCQPDAWAGPRREIRQLALGDYHFDAAQNICKGLGMNHSATRRG